MSTTRKSNKINRDKMRSVAGQLRQARIQGGPAPEAPMWSDLKEVFDHCNAISHTPAFILPYVTNRELTAKLKNPSLLATTAGELAKDLTRMRSDLHALSARHLNRTDDITEDNIFEMLSVGEEYVNWEVEFMQLIMPRLEDIVQMFVEVGIDVKTPITPKAG